MKLNGKAVRLDQLAAELAGAGMFVPALGQSGDELHTYNPAGEPVDLPPEAQAVVNAHVPWPVEDPRAALIDTMSLAAGDRAILKDVLGVAS